MSQQFVHIPSLLTPEEIISIENLVSASNFIDGKLTASMAAKDVKNNLQLEANNDNLKQIQQLITGALQQSPLFSIAALPQHIYPFLVSKYTAGKYYGWHVDSPVMGTPAIRTDLAMTVFLSDPNTYEGGELLIQSAAGTSSFKPAKGDAVL